MSILGKVKGNLQETATMARDGVEDMKVRHELAQAYEELGRRTVGLMNAGKLKAAALDFDVDRIRKLEAETRT